MIYRMTVKALRCERHPKAGCAPESSEAGRETVPKVLASPDFGYCMLFHAALRTGRPLSGISVNHTGL